jgi:neopullulanase
VLLLAPMFTCVLHARSVAKIEPPGWWAAHSIRPVRVLVTGQDLVAKVSSSSPLLVPGTVKLSADRQYAFFDLAIASSCTPGRYTITIGGAPVPFHVLKPLPRVRRFSGFSPDDVIYLIMPDRFANGDPTNDGRSGNRQDARKYHGGDLRGIIDRLPYLKNLGITTIWLTPVVDNTDSGYHGYHAVDFYKLEEHFGDVAMFHELVDAAHGFGIKIMQDQVANHVGPEHPWVDSPPTPTWFHGTRSSHLRSDSAMWSLVDPYASPGLSRAMLEGWFVDQLPDLNQDDPEVERYLIQNTLWWIGVTGVDAVRADTVPYVPKRFWRRWMRAIQREYPRFQVLAEVYSSDPAILAHFQDLGVRLFDFPGHEVLREVFIRGLRLPRIPAVLIHDKSYVDANRLVTFLGSHDVPRFREQGTHDALKSAFQFLLTGRGTPMIYYGDEIGLKGGGDPDNRRDYPPGAFDAERRTAEEQDVFGHVQRLLRLRAATPALRRGRLTNLLATGDSYVYARHIPGEPAVIVALGKGARIDAAGVPSLPESIRIPDALGSNAVATRAGDSIDITGPGVFVVPAAPSAGTRPQRRRAGARSSLPVRR